MRQAMRLLLVGTAIVGARGRVTPGLCFELRLSKKRAALRRNPTTRATCVALDKSVHEGKGKCKPGKGIFCNARNC